MAPHHGCVMEQERPFDSVEGSLEADFDDPEDEDDGLGRSYVCSLSSTIDLGVHVDGADGALALSVQRYLSQIVEELHLLSGWTAGVYQRQQQNQQRRIVSRPRSMDTSVSGGDGGALTATRLAVATDMELLRRDVAKAQHELFQRFTTQLAYVQSAVRGEREAQYEELQRRVDDKLRGWEQQTLAAQAVEKTRSEGDAQARAVMAATLRQMQQQTAEHHARLTALEKTQASISGSQFSQQQELQVLQRRADNAESTQHLQLEATRRAVDDSLTGLRAAHSQLSAKLQVLRLELQEHSDGTQRRIQQLLKVTSPDAVGKAQLLPPTAVNQRKASVGAAARTTRPGGSAVSSHQLSSSGSGVDEDSLDGILGGGSSSGVMMYTGAGAVKTPDCFLYARAALPHRDPLNEAVTAAKKPTDHVSIPSTPSRSAVVASASSSGDGRPQDAMANLLVVQQSVMSVPLGYEDDTRPPAFTVSPSVQQQDRSDNSAIPPTDTPTLAVATRSGGQRHNSLPASASSPSPRALQASRLYANAPSPSLRSVLTPRKP
ncbi:hypothetical protein BBJ28_00017860 [Nothophytophthora sp. Chile5]|nr:hypothetical protein BBJ28_00017860 [Nothophytophthora sp. Chile5]